MILRKSHRPKLEIQNSSSSSIHFERKTENNINHTFYLPGGCAFAYFYLYFFYYTFVAMKSNHINSFIEEMQKSKTLNGKVTKISSRKYILKISKPLDIISVQMNADEFKFFQASELVTVSEVAQKYYHFKYNIKPQQ